MSDGKDHNPPIGFEPLSLGMGRVTIKDLRRSLGMGRVTIKDLLGALAFDLVALLRPPIVESSCEWVKNNKKWPDDSVTLQV